MLLLGLLYCDFVLYLSAEDKVAIQTVQFDQNYVSNLVMCLIDVYFDHVLPWIYQNSVAREN